jgi:hypothetical protein
LDGIFGSGWKLVVGVMRNGIGMTLVSKLSFHCIVGDDIKRRNKQTNKKKRKRKRKKGANITYMLLNELLNGNLFSC